MPFVSDIQEQVSPETQYKDCINTPGSQHTSVPKALQTGPNSFQVPADPLNSFYIYRYKLTHGCWNRGSCASCWVKSSYRRPHTHTRIHRRGWFFLGRAWALWWGWVYRRVKLQVFQPPGPPQLSRMLGIPRMVMCAEGRRVKLLGASTESRCQGASLPDVSTGATSLRKCWCWTSAADQDGTAHLRKKGSPTSQMLDFTVLDYYNI